MPLYAGFVAARHPKLDEAHIKPIYIESPDYNSALRDLHQQSIFMHFPRVKGWTEHKENVVEVTLPE